MKHLRLVGRRWFNKKVGNTYHSCEIFVDHTRLHKIDFAYGYGSQWEDNAVTWLKKNNHLPDIGNEPIWRYCERKGIEYIYHITDVQRKRDL